MSVSLSIKDVPNELARALRVRARRNHRSMQGELLHILEEAVRPRPFRGDALHQEIRRLGLTTSAEAVEIVRDGRRER